jgi:hypothetical protein
MILDKRPALAEGVTGSAVLADNDCYNGHAST